MQNYYYPSFVLDISLPTEWDEASFAAIYRLAPLGATIITDAWGGYNNLSNLGHHHWSCNHSHAFSNPLTVVNSNLIECTFGNFNGDLTKPKGIPQSHWQRHLDAWCFKRNRNRSGKNYWRCNAIICTLDTGIDIMCTLNEHMWTYVCTHRVHMLNKHPNILHITCAHDHTHLIMRWCSWVNMITNMCTHICMMCTSKHLMHEPAYYFFHLDLKQLLLWTQICWLPLGCILQTCLQNLV